MIDILNNIFSDIELCFKKQKNICCLNKKNKSNNKKQIILKHNNYKKIDEILHSSAENDIKNELENKMKFEKEIIINKRIPI